jgi:S1-C subfamily serine protease
MTSDPQETAMQRTIPRLAASGCVLALLALAAPAAQAQSPTPLEALDRVTESISRDVQDSVVLIECERSGLAPRQLTQMERMGLGVNGPYDERFFSRPEGPCSGVVLGERLVATSAWNLDGEGAVTVVGPDGTRYPARRVGRDENLSVSLLEVERPIFGTQPMTYIPGSFGLAPGRFVFLVARTADNSPLVTRGIVSGMDRHRGDSFAHSARTNYASAGGALVDLDGNLVGISVRHTDRTRQLQNSGVGFGAPAPNLHEVLPRLAQGEVIPRRQTPFLGIQADINATGDGVRIQRVLPDTAAAAAGIEDGDWIRIFNQVEIKTFNQLREEIQSLAIGTEIVVTVVRGEETLDIRVKLGGRVEED